MTQVIGVKLSRVKYLPLLTKKYYPNGLKHLEFSPGLNGNIS